MRPLEDPLVSLTIGSFGETIRGSFDESYDRG